MKGFSRVRSLLFILAACFGTVIGSTFHMHQKGKRASVSVIRGGDVIHSSSIDFFDFEQSGAQPSRQEGTFELLPGDSFRSACYYDSPDEDHAFGFSSQDEMCITALMYYPRKKLFNQFTLICGYGLPLAACATEHIPSFLGSTAELGRTFGLQADEGAVCLAPATTMTELDNDSSLEDEEEDDRSSASGIAIVAGLACPFILAWMW